MNKCSIILSGCSGRLGASVAKLCETRENTQIVCGVDIKPCGFSFPIYEDFDKIVEKADVIVDCSHHSLMENLLAYAKKEKLPVVICTTGHTEDEMKLISDSAKEIPILKSRNMSLGINLLMELVRKSAAALGDDFDIEIVEAHHSKKLDAPSGTALMLADAAKEVKTDAEYIYDRHNVRRERGSKEIGIHSVRGGTIVGEHSVIFAGCDEVITISHSASSRDLFASGAIKAALFISSQKPGFYSMSDVIKQSAN